MGTSERGLSGLVRCVQFICSGKKHLDSVHTFAPTMLLVSYPHSAIPLEVRPYFQRYGAVRIGYEEHGWGEGMHRVEMLLPAADKLHTANKS